MSTEEQLKEQKEFEKKALRQARITNIILGMAAVTAILFMFYGFTQGIEAGRQREEAESQKSISDDCARKLVEANANLQKALTEAQLARMEAEKQYQLAQDATAKAKAKK